MKHETNIIETFLSKRQNRSTHIVYQKVYLLSTGRQIDNKNRYVMPRVHLSVHTQIHLEMKVSDKWIQKLVMSLHDTMHVKTYQKMFSICLKINKNGQMAQKTGHNGFSYLSDCHKNIPTERKTQD